MKETKEAGQKVVDRLIQVALVILVLSVIGGVILIFMGFGTFYNNYTMVALSELR